MIDDEDVKRSDRIGGRCHELLRDGGIGEVHLGERHLELPGHPFRASRLRAPRLSRVVLRPALDEDGSAGFQQLACDRAADTRASADTRDERVPAAEVHGTLDVEL
jgi:hypothetical protein